VIVTLATDAAAIVVPTVAVQASDEGQYVFVVKPDQTVDVRTITISRTNGAETLIKDGLKAGESVVTDGQVRLVKGSRVSIKTGLNDKVAG
jgi:multidrug efflux system membrane fusion protein